jgi:hypothetical protein
MIQTLRPSLDQWSKAIVKAQEAQNILASCDCSSLDVWEHTGQRGLQSLEERLMFQICSMACS